MNCPNNICVLCMSFFPLNETEYHRYVRVYWHSYSMTRSWRNHQFLQHFACEPCIDTVRYKIVFILHDIQRVRFPLKCEPMHFYYSILYTNVNWSNSSVFFVKTTDVIATFMRLLIFKNSLVILSTFTIFVINVKMKGRKGFFSKC